MPTVQIPTPSPPTQPDGGDVTTIRPPASKKSGILSLKIPTGNPEYYQGPQFQPETPDVTVRPEAPTLVPPGQIGDIRAVIRGLTPMPREIVNDNDDPQQSQTTVVSDAFTDDDFEQLNALGEGAGGVVHRVKEKRTQKIMARKTITTREAPLKQLLRELQTTSSNKHPNIINFFGAYMSPSTSEVKILMEFCEGGSLEAVSKQIKERGAVVGEVIAARIAEGVLQGLAYLHSRKTIHRDIKPSNILLSQDGVIKLCDFGVSGELVNSLAGTFTGTSMYMAPERISGNEYSIRSDVWSMGISLLELAQNRFPFPNELPPIELMMHITQGDPPMLEDEGGVVWSDDMKDFIKLSLIHDQSVRPIPKDMLVHPWILKGVKEEVHMSRWIRQVWGWKPPKPKSREGSN